MAQKIKYWLLISLILSLGFGQLLRFEFHGIPIFIHDILIVLFLIVQIFTLKVDYILGKIKTERIHKYFDLTFFITGMIIGLLRGLTIYPIFELFIASLYSVRLLAYIAVFLLLKAQKIKIPYSIFYLSGLVTIVIGIIQYFLIPDMRIFQYLGWDDHLSRLILPHFDPTFTGIMIGIFSLTILSFSSVYKIPLVFFSGIAIMLTYARSVWLSLLLLGFLFIKNQKILFIFVVTLIITIIALPQSFGEGTNLLRTYSISSRIDSDIAYVNKYKWDLLIGRGMNTMVLDSGTSDRENHATGPNNSFLYLLTTTGLLGLVGWIMFLVALYKSSHQKTPIIFIIIASFFNNVMFYPFALLWILVLESTAPSEV